MKTPLRLALLLTSLALGGCTAQIQHGLEERDANEVIAVLVERGFKAQKVPEKGKKPTWAIEVEEEHVTEAYRVLTELKLPRAARPTTRSIMQSAGLIETPSAERLRQLEAEEGDLEETLESMDGVTSAAVELVVPAPARPGLPASPSKASVLLRVRPEAFEHLQQQRTELRALVAGSVEGLKPDDVVLVVDQVTLSATPASRAAEALGQPGASAAPAPADLRGLVLAMGIALSVLAVLLIVLAWRVRAAGKRPAPASPEKPAERPAAPAPSRPIVNAAVQRKVA